MKLYKISFYACNVICEWRSTDVKMTNHGCRFMYQGKEVYLKGDVIVEELEEINLSENEI